MAVLSGTDIAKSYFRQRYFNEILGGQLMKKMRPIFLLTALLGPVLAIIHLGLALSTCIGRKIMWSGRTYELSAPDRVKVLFSKK